MPQTRFIKAAITRQLVRQENAVFGIRIADSAYVSVFERSVMIVTVGYDGKNRPLVQYD